MKVTAKHITLIFVFAVFSNLSFAQTSFLRSDFQTSFKQAAPLSLYKGKKQCSLSLFKVKEDKEHSPKKAALLSLIPGLGQAYNKKYWKIPIIYAGLGTVAYFFDYNRKEYKSFRTEYKNRLDTGFSGDFQYPLYSTEQVRQEKNFYWKQRDQMVLIALGVYLLQIVDATVDAHLFSFDISDDLSMRVEPDIRIGNANSYNDAYGLKLSFKF